MSLFSKWGISKYSRTEHLFSTYCAPGTVMAVMNYSNNKNVSLTIC